VSSTASAHAAHGDSHGHAGADHGGGHGHHPSYVAHHFDTAKQQFDTGKFGIWMFLVTEVLFFSGLFCAYLLYRAHHPEIFIYAHHYLDTKLGAVNTVVLLFSSLTMAWAVRAAALGQKKVLVWMLILTLACAFGFLGIKYIEYSHKIHDGLVWGRAFNPAHLVEDYQGPHPKNVHIFFGIYFGMTGLHGIHVLGGIVVIGWLLKRALRGEFHSQNYGAVDFVGLYWHLVDLIWIYLFPLLYLIH
jgi:cytochrome c oxidase subunit 3